MDSRKANKKGSKKSKATNTRPPAPVSKHTNPEPHKAPQATANTNPSRKRGIESISSSHPAAESEETKPPFDHLSFPNTLTQSTPIPAFTAAHLDPPSLHATCNPHLALTSINIISSTSIEKKVTSALKTLAASYPPSENEKQKPVVVLFCAKGDVAAKMISIVEIVKRNIGSEGGKWFQYTAVDGKVVEPTKSKEVQEGKKEMGETTIEEDGEEDEFEVMKTPFERIIADKVKVRSVPVMAVYLSRMRIEDLRKKHGEQTNAEAAVRDA